MSLDYDATLSPEENQRVLREQRAYEAGCTVEELLERDRRRRQRSYQRWLAKQTYPRLVGVVSHDGRELSPMYSSRAKSLVKRGKARVKTINGTEVTVIQLNPKR